MGLKKRFGRSTKSLFDRPRLLAMVWVGPQVAFTYRPNRTVFSFAIADFRTCGPTTLLARLRREDWCGFLGEVAVGRAAADSLAAVAKPSGGSNPFPLRQVLEGALAQAHPNAHLPRCRTPQSPGRRLLWSSHLGDRIDRSKAQPHGHHDIGRM